MPRTVEISFSRTPKAISGAGTALAVLLVAEEGGFAEAAASVDPAKRIGRAIEVAEFKGKAMATLDIIAPADSPADRILLAGIGDPKTTSEHDWARLGGQICSKFANATKVTIHLSLPGAEIGGAEAAQVAMGILLRAYRFDRYKTKAEDGENGSDKGAVKVVIVTPAAAAARKAFDDVEAVVGGVTLARDLLNEPANILGPLEFAAKTKKLSRFGFNVKVPTEKE